MIYNIKKIDDDTIEHQLLDNGKIKVIGRETGISKIENLQEHLQDWATQRKQVLRVKKVTNNMGIQLKQEFRMATLKNTSIDSTGFLKLPSGTTSQRPTASNGQLRFNTTLGLVEWYDSQYSNWFPAGVINPVASGGTTTDITQGGVNYRVHAYYTPGNSTFTVTRGGKVEYLIVAGGGGGGMDMGGGGGGGGVIMGETNVTPQTYTVSVGAGGYGAPAGGGGTRTDGAVQSDSHQFTVPATNGKSSSALGFTAVGGGYGGSSYYGYTPDQGRGQAGGSGGGNSGYSDGNVREPVPGTAGQGHRGGRGGGQYYSGGGGGAGGPGTDSPFVPHGGQGVSSIILGPLYFFGGGGGGSAYSAGPGGNGGIGGGGGGAVGTTVGGTGINNGSAGGGGSNNTYGQSPGGDAGANTGGGGGGGSHYNRTNQGGEGGSGIVVIRYRIDQQYIRY